jgi:exonuclease SbcC
VARPAELAEETSAEALAEAATNAQSVAAQANEAAEASSERLAIHRAAEEQQAENLQALRQAEKDGQVWATLNGLIGVGDGAKFRKFAQALNLGQLLDKANVHLRRLNDRYELHPRLEDGLPTLEFELGDLWQAGARVSTRSLSGGERFLVSLALALGLSDFRGVRMPVETLLLDEGFGTLDPASLSTALAALDQLQADGRQVGIISHVVGLADSIPARIRIEPLGGGRSRIVP